MKKTIFGFICAILMGCGFVSCNSNGDAQVAAADSTEVVTDSVNDSIVADSTVTVDSVAEDSVA